MKEEKNESAITLEDVNTHRSAMVDHTGRKSSKKSWPEQSHQSTGLMTIIETTQPPHAHGERSPRRAGAPAQVIECGVHPWHFVFLNAFESWEIKGCSQKAIELN